MDYSIVDFCISLPSVNEAGEYLSQYLMTLAGMTRPQMNSFKEEFVRRKEKLPVDSNAAGGDHEDSDTLGVNGKKEKSKQGTMDMAKLLKEKAAGEVENSSNTASGKKKSKKGKKVVDPSLLGFSVTSNRIMMGEIQHIED